MFSVRAPCGSAREGYSLAMPPHGAIVLPGVFAGVGLDSFEFSPHSRGTQYAKNANRRTNTDLHGWTRIGSTACAGPWPALRQRSKPQRQAPHGSRGVCFCGFGRCRAAQSAPGRPLGVNPCKSVAIRVRESAASNGRRLLVPAATAYPAGQVRSVEDHPWISPDVISSRQPAVPPRAR